MCCQLGGSDPQWTPGSGNAPFMEWQRQATPKHRVLDGTVQTGVQDGFWVERGKCAKLSLSIKIYRRKINSRGDKGEDRRRLDTEIAHKLQTIHPNPGPRKRNKTEEGKIRRRERRKLRRLEKRQERQEEINRQENRFVDIVAWNVQRMSVGTRNKRKAKTVAEEMIKKEWDVILLAEVRGENRGVVWLGEDEKKVVIVHSEKATVMLRGRWLEAWLEEGQKVTYDERVVSVRMKHINFISVYMPVDQGHNTEEIEKSREDIRKHKAETNRDDIVIIGGDFNAHIGSRETRPGICGQFGLRVSNRQGRELLDFCDENQLTHVDS